MKEVESVEPSAEQIKELLKQYEKIAEDAASEQQEQESTTPIVFKKPRKQRTPKKHPNPSVKEELVEKEEQQEQTEPIEPKLYTRRRREPNWIERASKEKLMLVGGSVFGVIGVAYGARLGSQVHALIQLSRV